MIPELFASSLVAFENPPREAIEALNALFRNGKAVFPPV
jgi:hypothetical protein